MFFPAKRRRYLSAGEDLGCRKRLPETTERGYLFDYLPEDIVISVLSKLSSSAASPSDFFNFLITCKRLNDLGLNSVVLSKASPNTFAIKAQNWSDSSHRFLNLCADAGNVEACYTLGMI